MGTASIYSQSYRNKFQTIDSKTSVESHSDLFDLAFEDHDIGHMKYTMIKDRKSEKDSFNTNTAQSKYLG